MVKHTAAMLPCGWGVRVVHGGANGDFIRDALADVRGARFTQLSWTSAQWLNDSSYNALLKSEWFWNLERDAKKVLVFQLDAVVLR